MTKDHGLASSNFAGARVLSLLCLLVCFVMPINLLVYLCNVGVLSFSKYLECSVTPIAQW